MLSTLPLGSLVMVELPFGGARWVAQLARVTGRTRSGRAWSLQVGNFHFDVGPIGPSALSAIRARQPRAIAQIADSTGAVVVGGDLNASSSSASPTASGPGPIGRCRSTSGLITGR